MNIRPMVTDDVAAAVTVCAANGWGGMSEHFSFYLTHSTSHPFVGEVDGTVVATAVATCRGRAGWVGLISVQEQHRQRGIGAAITQHVMDYLRDKECRTLLLFATDAGRPVYERLGFEVDTEYKLMGGPTLAQFPGYQWIRPLEPEDVADVIDLDRLATGEDRSVELSAYSKRGGWVTMDGDRHLTGFLLQTPWATSAVTTTIPEHGQALLDVERAVAGRQGQGTTYCVLPVGNTSGLAYLEQEGFRELRRFPRMVWGEPLTWRPEFVWSRVSGAMG